MSATIGLAVAAVPEGLAALVTVTLALGVQQMAKRRAISRRLPAVETLGSVTKICSDKTGTLTQNEMTVRTVRTYQQSYEVTGVGYAPIGEVRGSTGEHFASDSSQSHQNLKALTAVVSLCNDSTISEQGQLVGEPTEGALQTFALKTKLHLGSWSRLDLIPFESVNKFMVTLDEGPQTLELPPTSAITKLELCGLVGIVDPPRPEAVAAIAKCKSAGIKVKMITGDHAGTALAISRELGIVKALDARVLTGPELEAMTTEQLKAVVQDVHVFARTSPEHKIRIVSALQSHGEVVAMTGDGVNNAPALTQADVGVAMGIKGTDATKEAADVVLADDNFATIERAVEEGRRTYDNIRKSVLFLLPTNGAQSLVILVAITFGLTLPLQPVQVLWINMISAVTLSLALAYEPAEHSIMARPPRDVNARLVDRPAIAQILFISILIGVATLIIFIAEFNNGATLAQAQTAAVTMLALAQLAYLFSCRFLTESSLTLDVLKGNRIIWVSAVSLIALQISYVYLPFMNTWFGSAPISARQWLVMIGGAIVIFLIAEANKWVGRRR
ncbi:HAD-IC family P-type ATPase [Jonesiaceae bacterium BS-20]|uniref:HAD-IC family P-type ATPase n=1 Tax=Jonesiaceae bacterium BS-20 TaxID=3120821 RepID=A0AAU7DYA9_9MICO